jgi:hypothetical protein
MNFAEGVAAEQMMRLSIRVKNSHGFRTGIENYCQAMFGMDGLMKIKKKYEHKLLDEEMAQYAADSEKFMNTIHHDVCEAE